MRFPPKFPIPASVPNTNIKKSALLLSALVLFHIALPHPLLLSILDISSQLGTLCGGGGEAAALVGIRQRCEKKEGSNQIGFSFLRSNYTQKLTTSLKVGGAVLAFFDRFVNQIGTVTESIQAAFDLKAA